MCENRVIKVDIRVRILVLKLSLMGFFSLQVLAAAQFCLSLTLASLKQPPVDDVLSSCAAVLAEWVSYSIVKKSLESRSDSSVGRRPPAQVSEVGVSGVCDLGDMRLDSVRRLKQPG